LTLGSSAARVRDHQLDQITLNQWLIIVLNAINATDFIVLSHPGYPDPFGGTAQPPGIPNTELFDPGMNTPYAAHLTAGLKQEVGNGFAVSADYVFVRGYDQLRRRDLNAPPDGTTRRPNTALGRQLIHESTGDREHHALLVSADRRFSARWRMQASYTMSSTKSDSEARNSTALPTNQYDLEADWGPADVDARHNLSLTGQVVLPFDIHLAGILQARSAYPFNPVSGRDTNNDSRSGDRPDPDPNGRYPTNGVTDFGRFSIPVNRPGTLSRNAFRGANFRTLDLRLSKVVPMGRRRLELIAEGFNVTNRVNYGSYTGSIQSAFFGRPQSAMDPRRETYEKLRRAQDLLRHAIPNGDPALIVDKALTLLIAHVERTKLAATQRPRESRPTNPRSRHIAAAVRRTVWARDGGRCAFVGTQGRCTETGFLEFHHVEPYAVGGEAVSDTIELRCRAHNGHEAEQYFGALEVARRREQNKSAENARRRVGTCRSVRT
jgi:hypothetical protein